MTKSDWTRDQIDEGNSYSRPRNPSYAHEKKINAFDTETHDGEVFMLTYAFEDSEGYSSGMISNEEVEPVDREELFGKITSGRCRNAINVWYNMGFDADAILGTVLNDQALGILKGVDQLNALFISEDATVEEIEEVEYVNRHGTEKVSQLSYRVECEERGEEKVKWFHLDSETEVKNSAVISTDNLNSYYQINYLDGKLLTFKDRHGHTYRHYDISQFFFTSLENATEEWLPENQKKLDSVDTSKFGSGMCDEHEEVVEDCSDCWTKEQAVNYIKSEWETIVEYATVDAEVTYQLAQTFIGEAEDLGIPMGSPISTGYIAEEYMRARSWIDAYVDILETYTDEMNEEQLEAFEGVDYGPNDFDILKTISKDMFSTETSDDDEQSELDMFREEVNEVVTKSGHAPKSVERDLWESYKGGRFEVFERGEVGEVAGPDINSAYPSVLKDLPDPRTMDWHYIEDPTVDQLGEYDYGVLRVEVTTDSSRRIQPFAVKDYTDGGTVKYPALDSREVTVIKEVFEHAHEQDLIEEYDMKRAWVGSENEDTVRRFEWLEDIYAQRNKYKARGKDKKQMLLKIIINSVYGKLCQTTWKKEIITNKELDEKHSGEMELGRNQRLVDPLHMSQPIREYIGDDTLIASLQAGNWWNPFYATYITGMTRLELHKQTLEYGLEEDTYMFATDCVLFDKEAYENSDFGDDLFVDGELGMWDSDYGIDERAHATIFGTGVYEVEFLDVTPERMDWDDCPIGMSKVDYYMKSRFKTKTRGFPEAILEPNMRRMGYEHPAGIPLSIDRPLSLTESLMKPDLNASQFIKSKRTLNAGFDSKRVWQNENPTFVDLVEGSEYGEPLQLGEPADPQEAIDWWEDLTEEEQEELSEEVEVVDEEEVKVYWWQEEDDESEE